MHGVPAVCVNEFLDACHDVAVRGLVKCSSGNLSTRVDDERMLIKGSRAWMERLGEGDVSLCRIADGALLSGEKPSVELGFHRGIFQTRSDANVVLHFQSPYATVLACRGDRDIDYAVTPEIPFYMGPIAIVPYLPPGSQELAEAVVGAAAVHDMVVMQNHGQVTVAEDVDHAVQNAEFFEMACRMLVLGGADVRPLPCRAVEELLALRAERRRSAV